MWLDANIPADDHHALPTANPSEPAEENWVDTNTLTAAV